MDVSLKTISHYMCDDYTFITENGLTDEKLKSIVNSYQHATVFLAQNTDIYYLRADDNTDRIRYVICGKLPADAAISRVIDMLGNHEIVVISGESDQILGYLDASILSKSLFLEYKHLQAYTSTILETIDTSCTVIDKDQNVIAWSKGAENLFSVNQADIMGKPITRFFYPDHLEIIKTLNDGTSLHRSQHKARENQVVLINSKPVHQDQQIIGAVVSETDITSQIKLNKELYNTSEKLFTLEKEVNKLMDTENPFINIRGNSGALKQTFTKIKKAASTGTNILIQGESGVGKELFAKAGHHIREGQHAPFVAINCGAIPAALFESEMFGYEKGAFSGANQKGKKGKVELAKGGTLFLDEIGEMPLEMQVKMLRLLQDKKFYPVGATKEVAVDFRVIAATNSDLEELIKEGQFREDLYYRLNVVSIDIPSLRKRPEDIIELTHYFLHEVSIKYNRPIHGISQDVMQALLKHHWPGNIRELKNVIERLVVFSEEGTLKLEDLPFDTDPPQNTDHSNNQHALSERLQAVEKEIILKELKKANNNKLTCAKNLQITRATLYNRLKKLGIDN